MATRASQVVDPSNRGPLDWLFDPLNAYVVDPLTSILTNRIALPVLNKTYFCLGGVAVWLVRRVNGPIADKMQEGLKDPFSTETLLSVVNYVENVSLEWGKRSPNAYTGVHYFDMCTIITARHVHTFASDAKVLLNAPATLRRLTGEICTAAEEEIVNLQAPSGNKSKEPMVKKRTLFLEQWEEGHSMANPIEVLPKTGLVTALNTLRQEVSELISAREKEVRQKITGDAVHSACKAVIGSTTRTAIKVGVAYVCHQFLGGSGLLLLSPAISEMAQNASAGVNAAGACLLLRCSKTVDNFYNCRISDVRASILRAHAIGIGQENIVYITGSIKTKFTAHASQGALERFEKRAAGHRIEILFEDGVQPFLQTPAQRALFNASVAEVV